MTMMAIAQTDHEINDDRRQPSDAAVSRILDRPKGPHLRIVGESVEWRGALRDARQVAATDTTVLGATLQPPSKRLEAREQERQEIHHKIDAELHMVGLRHFGEAIAQRMELIEVLATRFNNDSRMIRRICLAVLDRIASILEPELQSKLDADSRRDMSIAAYLHDIGKSGPFDAPQATQEAIVKLYAVENVAGPDQTIAKTVRMNFSFEEAKSVLEHLGSCGMRSTDTMRAFWDRHGYWTHDILEADSEDIPSRARVVAGSHHMDRGIDPYGFSSADYVAMLENRILMAVDKYQAAVVRSQKTHGEAMEIIKRILSPKYGNDMIMDHVLKVVDEVRQEESLLAAAS